MARELSRLQAGALSAWRAMLPADAQVFWWKRHGQVWLGLGRSSYVSLWQGAGSIFDRATAFEADRRLRAVREAGVDVPGLAASGVGSTTGTRRANPRSLCAADPLIDFVVLAGEATGSAGEPYVEGFGARAYRLYPCVAQR